MCYPNGIFMSESPISMKALLIPCFAFLILTAANAQDLSVPDAIKQELETVALVGANGESIRCKVRYPKNYTKEKAYPVFLGISGGGQSEPVVEYCYAAWFRSHYFEDYLTIMPINDKPGSFRDYDAGAIAEVMGAIKKHFNVKESAWIAGGTSNGGVAAFNFVASEPALFNGVVVVPGAVSDAIQIDDAWNHLTVVLAYGEKDAEDWVNAATASKNLLSEHVKAVETMMLAGQGHMLAIDYNVDVVYDRYFKLVNS